MKKTTLILFFFIGLLLTYLWQISPVFSFPSSNNSPQELVEQARENFTQGNFQDSITKLEQAAKIFANQGETIQQAITLTNLSNTYQQLGEWEPAEKAIKTSLELLGFNSEIPKDATPENLNILAASLDIYGSLLFKKGQSEKALETWKQSASIYQKSGNINALITNQLNQVQALQSLGLYQLALGTIRSIEQKITDLSTTQKIKVWRSLGESYRTVGDLKKSQEYLEKSLQEAIQTNSAEIAAIQLSLGNTYRALGDLEKARINTAIEDYTVIPWRCISDRGNKIKNALVDTRYQKAVDAYQQAITLKGDPEIAVKASLNKLNLFILEENFSAANSVLKEIELSKIPVSRTSVYTKLNYARNLACLQEKSGQDFNSQIQQLLEQATQEAQNLQDQQSLSYALGNHGGYYEYLAAKQNNPELLKPAASFTQQAILYTQPSVYPSAAYQWQWQLARLLEAQGNMAAAIEAYQEAVKTLEIVRGDLKVINTDVQFSFRDNVEPIYRKLIDLIMKYEEKPDLVQVLSYLDALQLSELENFLRCDLSTFVQTEINLEASDPKAAYLYPIILRDRTEVLYKLPNQPLAHKSVPVQQSELEKITTQLQKNLARPDRTEEVVQDSQQLYDWLIKPLTPELAKNQDLKTLVFVLDGSLRNIPMAVLSDQGKYLIESYVIATVPSRKLFDPRPRSPQLRVLSAGVSEAQSVDGLEFRELPNVPKELQSINQLIDNSAQPLLNKAFTDNNLETEINSGNFPVVHIATHGVFSSDPEDTFILSWGKKVSVRELDRILRIANSDKTIQLLVLSACQTAQGNKRAALGLAGVAAQARVRTTLASLWQVDDLATANLISKFYQGLKNNKTIGEALRDAELEFLKPDSQERRPHYWAPFVVIGNWQ